MKYFVSAILLLLCAVTSNAQSGRLFSSSRELSSNLVNQICQDSRGFIWIATEDGLNRYDGYTFHIYRHDSSVEGSLTENYVYAMMEDSQGRFWIGYSRGIALYDRASDNFKPIWIKETNSYIKQFVELSNHSLWAATSGSGIVTISHDNKVSRFVQLNKAIKTNYVNALYQDRKGNVWIGTQNQGVWKYNLKTRRVKAVPHAAGDNNVNAIGEDFYGNILIAYFSGNLSRIDAMTGRQSNLHTNGGKLNTYSIRNTSDGNVYILTDGQGLKRYDSGKQTLEDVTNFSHLFGMEHAKVHSMIEDRNGNYWVGLYQKGVMFIPKQKSDFTFLGYRSTSYNNIGDCCVMSIFKKNGVAWVGTDNDGLYALDNSKKLLKHFEASQVPGALLSLLQDSKGNLWCGSFFNGLAMINTATGSCNYMEQFRSKTIYALAEDRQHNLWIGTYRDGLYAYHLDNHSMKHFTSHNSRLENDWINALFVDRDGVVWVGTCAGLACINHGKISFMLRGKMIYCLTESYNGDIWAGSIEGLYKLDAKTKIIELFTVQQGLPNNTICGVAEDNAHHLWVSTHHGLSKFIPKQNRFINYYEGDGLQGNEFSRGASFKSSDGELFFGGVGGITAFYPDKIASKRDSLRLTLTNFYISNKPVTASTQSEGDAVISTAVYDAKEFILANKDNGFAIELSVMDYADPDREVYQYRFDGDKEWKSLRPGSNLITITELPTGTHHFYARAISGDQISAPIEILIKIRPKWYLSTLAFIIYFLLAVAIAYTVYIYGKKRIEDKLQLDEAQENLKKLTSKYEFLDKLDSRVDDVELSSNNDELMERIINVINKNMSNDGFSVEMLAQEVGISRVHMYRKLKELTNMSAHDFIRTIRMQKAAKLLLMQKTNISEVAYATGFSSLSHFSNAFKSFYGKSPKEYIESHK